mmetsp:Transcript_57804/g.183268  ORF Transcript_57804/g.183268 Transcript_57804/m.183268 type:complete len:232 (-) Transcript_57804:191-886(-)
MFQHQIHPAEFEEDALACLPATPWSISQEEIKKRRDLRLHRIFSIDPPTARDLDDALSIEMTAKGTFKVGVHIADVSHFIPAGSALDEEARRRSTSVYLVQRVLPMLPRLLCEELCSLNPGVDRLAFSIGWEMEADGTILSQWAGRSVICSCAKLAYGHAQAVIAGEDTGEGAGPVEITGAHTWAQCAADVRALHAIAQAMRTRRFENGSIRLDNIKLMFERDECGNPESM